MTGVEILKVHRESDYRMQRMTTRATIDEYSATSLNINLSKSLLCVKVYNVKYKNNAY